MLLAAIVLAGALIAREPQLPPGVTCEQIRALVAEHGYAAAVYWARANGYTWEQIYEAKKCLTNTK